MNNWTSVLFYLAAVYDGLLGLVFLVWPSFLFSRYGVTPPNHYGYVQFPGALLVVFGIMFAQIARDPLKNMNLIPYGILLKVAYCGITAGYWIASGIPNMWKPFTIADGIMAIFFVFALSSLKRQKVPQTLGTR